MVLVKEKVYIILMMVIDMKDIGKRVYLMEKEYIIILVEINMRVIIKMI